MNIIRKLLLFFKNIFNNQKKLEAPPSQIIVKNEKADFINSLKVTTYKKLKKKKIETLICEGDGLGIQKKISY